MALISIKNVRRVIAAVAIFASYAYIDYSLPNYPLVRVDEIGTRRFDADGNYQPKGGESKGPTRDVEMIYTSSAYLEIDAATGKEVPKIYGNEEKDKLVFINEDTGFSFPFYFKFDTANLQGSAANMRGQFAYVKSFGWRNEIFTWFPNALKIIKYEPGMTIINFVRIAVTTLWALGIVGIWYGLRVLRRKVAAKVEAAAEAARAKAESFNGQMDAVGDRVDAFNNSQGVQTARRRFWKVFGGWW